MRVGWVGKTLHNLQEDIEGLKNQLARCGNPSEKEQLQDRLTKLRQARRCYLRWIFKACDR
ncbi:MAG: hypothetical protein ACOX0F_11570 [Syntrophomonadaceae bacterium]